MRVPRRVESRLHGLRKFRNIRHFLAQRRNLGYDRRMRNAIAESCATPATDDITGCDANPIYNQGVFPRVWEKVFV